MDLSDIQVAFNRALMLTFSRMKLSFVFVVLALCGLLIVFFRTLAIGAGQWVVMSLTFLPIFICAAALLAAGIILIRVYHNEIKQKKMSLWHVMKTSRELIVGATYLSIPIILTYLLLWVALGVFFFLSTVPIVGEFFSTILSFAPFLLNVAALLLCVLNLAMLFLMTPAIAFQGLDHSRLSQILLRRLNQDWFSNLLLATIALIPLLLVVGILVGAALLTDILYISINDSPLYISLQWFFIMIPFAALLSPVVIFFFNFAAEAHVLFQKKFKF